MAAPNIVGVTSIYGMTTSLFGSQIPAATDGGNATVLLSNPASSNKVLKINTLLVGNESSSTAVSVSIRLNNNATGSGTSVRMSSDALVSPGTLLQVISKDNPLYLEENRSITINNATALPSTMTTILSYESIN